MTEEEEGQQIKSHKWSTSTDGATKGLPPKEAELQSLELGAGLQSRWMFWAARPQESLWSLWTKKIIEVTDLRRCVKVEVAVLGSRP